MPPPPLGEPDPRPEFVPKPPREYKLKVPAPLPPGDHRGRAEGLVAAITPDPPRNLELTAHAAVAEAALAVADELAKLRELLEERLPEPPSLRLPEPRHFGVRAKRWM